MKSQRDLLSRFRRRPRRVGTLLIGLAFIASAAHVFLLRSGATAAAPSKVDPACLALENAKSIQAAFSLEVVHKDRLGTLLHDYNRSASGSFTLKPKLDADGKPERGAWRILGQPASLNAMEWDGIVSQGADVAYNRIQPQGEVTGAAYLSIDCQQGTYSLGASIESAESLETLVPPPNVASFCKSKDGAAALICGIAGVDTKPKVKGGLSLDMSIESEPMTPGQRTLSGSRKVKSNLNSLSNREIEGKLTWNLSLTPNPGDLFFEPPAKYDKWLPDLGSSGNPSKLKIMVRFKPKSPKDAPPVGRIDFALNDVSSEPGRWINDSQSQTTPDVRIVQTPGIIVTDNGAKAHTEREDVEKIEVELEILDTAAYAELTAECKAMSKKAKYELTHEERLTIPLDRNGNKIADFWEDKKGVNGKSVNWDGETLPSLNGTTSGDGLTLFEEYRGIWTKGGHRRLNPNKKELVIDNRHPDVLEGIALFGRATNIEIVLVNADGLRPDPNNPSDDTLVNAQSKTGHVGYQHGLRIVSATFSRSGVGGETIPRQARATRTKSPGEVIEIRIAPLPAGAPATAPPVTGPGPHVLPVTQASMAVDVAHELGHGIGAQHHGDTQKIPNFVIYSFAPGELPPTHQVYDPQGRPYLNRPIDFPNVGYRQNEASGDISCIMSYHNLFNWGAIRQNGETILINVDVTRLPTPDHFCSSPDGKGINADTYRKPMPVFGRAMDMRGNCIGQMRIKDY